MTYDYIRYREQDRYILEEDWQVNLSFNPGRLIDTAYIQLTARGQLTIRKGFRWNSPSDPIINTSKIIQGSLVYHALHSLMREGLLNPNEHRTHANTEMKLICYINDIGLLRTWYAHWKVSRYVELMATSVGSQEVKTV